MRNSSQSQQTSLQCLSTINMVLSDEDQISIKSLYLKRYTAKRLIDEFPEKSWTKHGVNKLFKKLRDTGTVGRRPWATADRAVPALKKTLRFFFQKFPQSLTGFVQLIVGWSDRKHLFYSAPQCSHCKRCISYGNSICPSVCLSDTRRYCVKTTARNTMQFTLLDSKMYLVL